MTEYIELEGWLDSKQTEMRGPPQMVQKLIMFERTKIMDEIYVKYNMKFNYLTAAADYYKLEQDDDISGLR